MEHPSIPLCVDLDGTLLRTDAMWEAVVLLLKKQPHLLFVLPFWLLQGKSVFKERVAALVALDVTVLPYHETLLAYLREQRAEGRQLLLVTGTPTLMAQQAADYVRVFDEVIGSGSGINLTGNNKAKLLVERFGHKGFDYIGNAKVDMNVWKDARKAIVVNAPESIRRAAKALGFVDKEFHDKKSVVRAFVRAIRPYQWTKNALIFVPFVTGHALGNGSIMLNGLIALIAFCCCTSCVYLLNDLLDLASDRAHPRKRFRPLASGDLPIPIAITAVPLLLIGSGIAASQLPASFSLVLVGYFILTLAYSLYLKQLMFIDVLVLAALYSVRIIAGHEASGLQYSVWLLVFAMFFFFSLALVKRYSELESSAREQKHTIAGRSYVTGDRNMVQILGAASGFIAAVVLALYITSDQVTRLYAYSEYLWAVIPVILYWITRIWIQARRGKMHDDPIVFALKDYVSYVVGGIVMVVLTIAT